MQNIELIFATNNAHKLQEVISILGHSITLKTLAECGITEDIPETAPTIEGNALQKARYIYAKTGADCFADDTGLEVDALGGEPGVRSARYAAGVGHDSQANMALLLKNMEHVADRRARFRTVIALIIGGQEHLFEGVVEGQITLTKNGYEGFGYDPIFMPEGCQQTFAQMSADDKNSISHRARATVAMQQFLAARQL